MGISTGIVNPVTVNGRMVISSIASSRFHISEKDIFDSETNAVYLLQEDVPFLKQVVTDIPGLVANGTFIGVDLLWALCLKPLIAVPDSILLDPNSGIKVFSQRYDYIESGDFVWQFPDDGIEHSFYGGFKYIPGATRYFANAAGEVKESTGRTIVSGSNREGFVLITTDVGEVIEIELARLVLLAHGKYTAFTKDDTIYYVDGDESNLDISNLSLVPVTLADRSRLAEDGELSHFDHY